MERELSQGEIELICAALERDALDRETKLVDLRLLQEMMRERNTTHSNEIEQRLKATLGVDEGIINAQRTLSHLIGRYGLIIQSPLILPEQA